MAAVTYNEAVDGDLDENSSTIALDIGQNTIIGSVSGTVTLTSIDVDFDGFRVTLPTGARIVSGRFTVKNFDINLSNAGPFFPVTFEILDNELSNPPPFFGDLQYYGTQNPNLDFNIATGPVSRDILETRAPEEGRPLKAEINAGLFVGAGDNFSLDYHVTLDVVAPIPLPAGGILLLTALAGMVFVRRKVS